MKKIERLIKRWRSQARRYRRRMETALEPEMSYDELADQLDECADQLEAALSDPLK